MPAGTVRGRGEPRSPGAAGWTVGRHARVVRGATRFWAPWRAGMPPSWRSAARCCCCDCRACCCCGSRRATFDALLLNEPPRITRLEAPRHSGRATGTRRGSLTALHAARPAAEAATDVHRLAFEVRQLLAGKRAHAAGEAGEHAGASFSTSFSPSVNLCSRGILATRSMTQCVTSSMRSASVAAGGTTARPGALPPAPPASVIGLLSSIAVLQPS